MVGGDDRIRRVLLEASDLVALFEKMEKNRNNIIRSDSTGLTRLYELTLLKEKITDHLKSLIFFTENLN